jgi:poly(A) polymerase
MYIFDDMINWHFSKKVGYNNYILKTRGYKMINNKTLQIIQKAIKNTSFEGKVFVAGGFVRDHFMGRPSKDIDLVVEGHGIKGGIDLAWKLKRILSNVFGFDVTNPVTFERFGTAQIVIGGEEVELVAARKESYNFKDRMPEVEAGTLEDDVARRDFT